MRRLIRPWTVPPAGHVKLIYSAIYLKPFHVGNSPVASRLCEHMSLHLPGLIHTLLTQHLRPRSNFLRHKVGRQQDLGYLEGGGLALTSRGLVFMTTQLLSIILLLHVMLSAVLYSLLVGP
jgi:hypothetical protein